IVAGDPENSLLIKAVRATAKDLQMPHKDKRLSDAQIAGLVTWVKMGAPGPRMGEKHTGGMAAKAKSWWAFQPVQRPRVPAAADGNPIDAFVDEQLATVRLKKAVAADRRSLLRRATLDLAGLPPT